MILISVYLNIFNMFICFSCLFCSIGLTKFTLHISHLYSVLGALHGIFLSLCLINSDSYLNSLLQLIHLYILFFIIVYIIYLISNLRKYINKIIK